MCSSLELKKDSGERDMAKQTKGYCKYCGKEFAKSGILSGVWTVCAR